MEFLLAEQNWPFAASLAVMLGLGTLELLAVLMGASLSGFLDGLLPEPGDAGGLAWLHLGKVPFMVVLVLYLALFAVAGLVIQALASAFSGVYLPVALAVPAAGLAALPATRGAAALVGRLLPHDETYALPAAGFVGRAAVIVAGEARKGRAAEAKFEDEHGQTHYVMVEPETPGTVLAAGERVLLTRQLAAGRYAAIVNLVVD